MFTPSVQQEIFFNWIRTGVGSCVLTAVAGAGKTTTLLYALGLMEGIVFLGAYNKKIADEIAGKAKASPNVTISTMHSAGLRAWRRAASPTVNAEKNRDIFRNMTRNDPRAGVLESSVLELVSYAKQAAIGVGNNEADSFLWMDLIHHFDVEVFSKYRGEDCTTEILSLALAVYRRSIEACKHVIDYDDMILAPLYYGVKIQKYDWVLIDEAQDTNRSRRLLALEMMKPTSRLVAVGDPHQAIYGFTGADADSLVQIQNATNAIELFLSTTFRCPKAVVKVAHEWVSHIQAHESAPEGIVRVEDVEKLADYVNVGDTVLCRFNAPLIKYVYQFIARGIPARVEGKDIASGMKTLVRRWKVETLSELLDKIEFFTEREVEKLKDKELNAKANMVDDRSECLKIIINRVQQIDAFPKNPVERVVQEIDAIFGAETSKPVVLFCSIHRSKGREWKRVIWLQCPPSSWATQQWEMEQELNLNYVGATRAMHELILVPISK